jgi:hypothetical protein
MRIEAIAVPWLSRRLIVEKMLKVRAAFDYGARAPLKVGLNPFQKRSPAPN